MKVTNRIEAYIQSKVLHKTLESVSLDYRRNCEGIYVESTEGAIKKLKEADVEKRLICTK